MSQEQKTATHIQVGRLGEQIASRFLSNEGFIICDRNYRKKWGEIDIIAQNKGILHFFEVKTLVRKDGEPAERRLLPEFNAHPKKLARLTRTIESYRMETRAEGEWRFELIAIELLLSSKQALIRRVPL